MIPVDRAVATMRAVCAHHDQLHSSGDEGEPLVNLPAEQLGPALDRLIADAVALRAVTTGPDDGPNRRSALPVLVSADGRVTAIIPDTWPGGRERGAVMHVDSDAGCNWYEDGSKGLWELAAEGLCAAFEWTDQERDLAIRSAALADELTRG